MGLKEEIFSEFLNEIEKDSSIGPEIVDELRKLISVGGNITGEDIEKIIRERG